MNPGVIGAGVMGLGIVRSLLRGGFVTHVRDVDPAREALAHASGARIAGAPAELGAHADVIFIVVLDAAQIDDVLEGPGGLMPVLGPGKTVLVNSTIAPGDTERFAARVCSTGAAFVDAPISGGPARAEAGTMSMMLAAPDAVLTAVDPMLRAVSDKRFVIGTRAGDAARAKLVNNLMAGIHLIAGAEAMALAMRLGLDPRQMSELIRVSSGQSWMFDDRMPRALAGDFEPRAQTHVLTKDLTLANAAAADAGVELPLGAVARDLLRATCDAGWRNEDDAAALKYYARRFGVHMPG